MEDKLTISLPPGAKFGRFRPTAYFDKHMDCIRVLTHDRSVTEHRISEQYTVYECNHRTNPFDPQYVGFTIKGVSDLFSEMGLPLDRPYRLADLIDKIVKHRPDSAMSHMLNIIFKSYEITGDLEVDFKKAA